MKRTTDATIPTARPVPALTIPFERQRSVYFWARHFELRDGTKEQVDGSANCGVK